MDPRSSRSTHQEVTRLDVTRFFLAKQIRKAVKEGNYAEAKRLNAQAWATEHRLSEVIAGAGVGA